jgi:hypothetical protein
MFRSPCSLIWPLQDYLLFNMRSENACALCAGCSRIQNPVICQRNDMCSAIIGKKRYNVYNLEFKGTIAPDYFVLKVVRLEALTSIVEGHTDGHRSLNFTTFFI